MPFAVLDTDGLGYDFWTRLIPHVSHSSFVVRSAVISAASVLESTQSQSQDPNGQTRVREGHRMNVRAIIKAAEHTDPEFALLACLIFASCELVLGALDAGMIHLQAGSKILRERIAFYAEGGSYRGSAAALLSEHVLPIFTAYSQITSLNGIDLSPTSENDMRWEEQQAGTCDCAPIPSVFVTIDQAHAHLRSTIHQIFTKHSRHSLQSQADFEDQQIRLDRWAIATNALELFRGSDDASQIKLSTMCLLRNQHRLAQVLLPVVFHGEKASSMSFEKYSFDFIWILAQYDSMKFERILANEAVEIISPLFIIAIITRDIRIRNEAVRLLESLDRTEANWNSQSALRIAKELVAHEESVDVISSPPITQFGWPKTLHECLQNASGMWVSTVPTFLRTSRELTVFLQPLGYILTMTGRFSLP